MSSVTPSDREAIAVLCKNHNETHDMWKHNFRCCVVYKSYFVKYHSHRFIRFEYETQKYIHSMTIDDPSALRVLKVVKYFAPEGRMAYLVMGFIDHATPADGAPEKVADALIASVPAPAGLVLGSVGDGPASHRVFKDYRTPLLFFEYVGFAKLHEQGAPTLLYMFTRSTSTRQS
ncbi:hypothetical protein BOTBODRAFT_39967 [Botryobasidium botryosum FD-172 SS1]|uniref:Uncharacterized protein n=1 Tax=Botryobasidium botryosum (strain FD-172 SS1) TaxID=930990 RepID=A0A067LRE4_BOTB1|nr:hypothetical protein BOTBODRAFT_39967 [Botryobasidium botryosum FD-172 SS1]